MALATRASTSLMVKSTRCVTRPPLWERVDKLSRERRLGLPDYRGECRLVGHRQIGKHLAIDFDRRFFQAVHEDAIGDPKLPGAGVDTGDPQAAKIALALTAIAIGVLARLHHRFLGDAVYVAAAAAETLGFV